VCAWLAGLWVALACAALTAGQAPQAVATNTSAPTPSATAKPAVSSTPAVTPTLGTRSAWRDSRIAFASNRGGSFQIYLMNPDGSELTQLTDSGGENTYPAWSRDGKRLAFISTRDGNPEIYIMDADGENQKNITQSSSNDSYPVWMADDRIAFVSNRKGRERIFLLDPSGKKDFQSFQLTSIDPSSQFLCLGWVAEGFLSFTTVESGSRQTRVVDTTTGETGRPDAFKGDHDRSCPLVPALTSDSWMIFISNRDGHDEIYRYNLQNQTETQLTKDSLTSLNPSRSSDEGWISFTSRRGGDWDIFIMATDGKNQWDVTNDPAVDIQPAWQPY
jgi:TolB protein